MYTDVLCSSLLCSPWVSLWTPTLQNSSPWSVFIWWPHWESLPDWRQVAREWLFHFSLVMVYFHWKPKTPCRHLFPRVFISHMMFCNLSRSLKLALRSNLSWMFFLMYIWCSCNKWVVEVLLPTLLPSFLGVIKLPRQVTILIFISWCDFVTGYLYFMSASFEWDIANLAWAVGFCHIISLHFLLLSEGTKPLTELQFCCLPLQAMGKLLETRDIPVFDLWLPVLCGRHGCLW